jgi:hypothetical protein
VNPDLSQLVDHVRSKTVEVKATPAEVTTQQSVDAVKETLFGIFTLADITKLGNVVVHRVEGIPNVVTMPIVLIHDVDPLSEKRFLENRSKRTRGIILRLWSNFGLTIHSFRGCGKSLEAEPLVVGRVDEIVSVSREDDVGIEALCIRQLRCVLTSENDPEITDQDLANDASDLSGECIATRVSPDIRGEDSENFGKGPDDGAVREFAVVVIAIFWVIASGKNSLGVPQQVRSRKGFHTLPIASGATREARVTGDQVISLGAIDVDPDALAKTVVVAETHDRLTIESFKGDGSLWRRNAERSGLASFNLGGSDELIFEDLHINPIGFATLVHSLPVGHEVAF